MNYKILFSLFGICLVIGGCSRNDQKKERDTEAIDPLTTIKTNAEAHLQTMLNDPKSYEFVSLEFIDTVTYEENINRMKTSHQNDLELANQNIQSQLEYQKIGSFIFDINDLTRSRSDSMNAQTILNGLDSIEKKLSGKIKEEAAYLLIFKYRAKNALGALVINENFLQVTAGPDFKVLNITDNTKRLFLTPNSFPGFEEFSKVYYKNN